MYALAVLCGGRKCLGHPCVSIDEKNRLASAVRLLEGRKRRDHGGDSFDPAYRHHSVAVLARYASSEVEAWNTWCGDPDVTATNSYHFRGGGDEAEHQAALNNDQKDRKRHPKDGRDEPPSIVQEIRKSEHEAVPRCPLMLSRCAKPTTVTTATSVSATRLVLIERTRVGDTPNMRLRRMLSLS